jgi:hypothetical protein
MKILIGLIMGIFFFFALGFKRVLAFLDLVPETCSFNTANMLPEYEDPGTLQFFGKILENTGYNWRHSGQAMLLENELIQPQGTKTYDTGRNYVDKYVMILYDVSFNELPLPYSVPEALVYPNFLQLTTSYQTVTDVALVQQDASEIKALATGGYSIRNTLAAGSYAYRLTGMIIELRRVTGA